MNRPPNKGQGKILIIDDDEVMSRVLKSFLAGKGYAVSAICRPEEAEKTIDLEGPDLIFLDYRMSPLTGKDILERLTVRGVETPVVMMSAYKRRDGDWEMKKLGAVKYLAKPFDFAEIELVLKAVFCP